MAKAKAKGITISNWEKMVVDKEELHTFENNGNMFEVTVSPTISWEQAAEIVEYVIRVVFDDETGDYHPEVKEPLFRAQVLEKYAHFSMPKSFDKIYYLVYATDAYDHVLQLVNTNQVEHLREAIDEAIDYRLGILANGIQAEIQRVMDSFQTFNENAESIFEKVDTDDIGTFIKKVSEMPEGLDEEKVVQLVHAANREKKEKPDGE